MFLAKPVRPMPQRPSRVGRQQRKERKTKPRHRMKSLCWTAFPRRFLRHSKRMNWGLARLRWGLTGLKSKTCLTSLKRNLPKFGKSYLRATSRAGRGWKRKWVICCLPHPILAARFIRIPKAAFDDRTRSSGDASRRWRQRSDGAGKAFEAARLKNWTTFGNPSKCRRRYDLHDPTV